MAGESALVPLPVVLNGARDYVQGTQIVARAAEHLRGRGASDLLSASFHEITDREVALCEGPPGEGRPILGEIAVRGADGGRARHALVALGRQAPRETRRMRARAVEASATGSLDAVFDLSGIAGLEDALDALVQSVKGLHERLGDDVSDVWFTGLRGRTFALSPEALPEDGGRLAITFGRLMRGGERWQTLMGFSLEAPGGGTPVLAGGLTFAFRSDRRPDVD